MPTCCHFSSAWRISLSIFGSASLLVMNSLSFYLSETSFFQLRFWWPFHLAENSRWTVFFFQSWRGAVLTSSLILSPERSPLSLTSAPLRVTCLLPSMRVFFWITGFEQFHYDMPCYSFLMSFCAWGFRELLEPVCALQFSSNLDNCGHCFFKYMFCPCHSPIFRASKYTYIGPWSCVTAHWCSVHFLLPFPSLLLCDAQSVAPPTQYTVYFRLQFSPLGIGLGSFFFFLPHIQLFSYSNDFKMLSSFLSLGLKSEHWIGRAQATDNFDKGSFAMGHRASTQQCLAQTWSSRVSTPALSQAKMKETWQLSCFFKPTALSNPVGWHMAAMQWQTQYPYSIQSDL